MSNKEKINELKAQIEKLEDEDLLGERLTLKGGYSVVVVDSIYPIRICINNEPTLVWLDIGEVKSILAWYKEYHDD